MAAVQDAVHLTVYLFPRQLFGRGSGDLTPGPPGLSCCFPGGPMVETGTYAAVVDPSNVLWQAIVYESDVAFDCFYPDASWRWRPVGRLASIDGFIDALPVDQSVDFFAALTRGVYLTMHVLKAGPGLIYLRIRSDRMPSSCHVVYRVFGIDAAADWYRGDSYRYDGIMSHDEANDAIDSMSEGGFTTTAGAPAMGPADEPRVIDLDS